MKRGLPFVFDLHCDTPHNIAKNKPGHIVPEKLREHKYLGAVFAHFIIPKSKYPFVDAVKLLSSTLYFVEQRARIQVVVTPAQVKKNMLNLVLGVEGGHIFDNTFKQVEALYHLGVRVFTITWNNSNKLAHSALENDKKGLTRRGKTFIKKMRDYDIIIDLSHASTRTVLDICELSENPVIASHSCVRKFRPDFKRNIADCAIQAIANRKGVVGINFSRYHLGTGSIFDHIDYLVGRFGIETAAIGSDFDGITDAVISSPAGLKGLCHELYEHGYRKPEVEKIFSTNFLRVLRTTTGNKKLGNASC
jgi:membrane dipeptidase